MNPLESTERIIAAEREAHFDGDLSRKHCEEKGLTASAHYAAEILARPDTDTCWHLDRVTYGSTGSVCKRCFMRWGPAI